MARPYFTLVLPETTSAAGAAGTEAGEASGLLVVVGALAAKATEDMIHDVVQSPTLVALISLQ